MSRLALVALTSLLVGFYVLLDFYGQVLQPPNPDEVLFVAPAQNLAEGKGMGTPVLDGLLPRIAERTYWQPPVYFITLSLWGKGFGFDLSSARTFSRLCGILGLVLVFWLARRWELPLTMSMVCVLWTALDLRYQYNANLARMDSLCIVFLMASLLAFTAGVEGQRTPLFCVAGLLGALAVLTHLIAVPIVLILLGELVRRRQVRGVCWFALPLLLGLFLWYLFAAQDWDAFVGQMAAQFRRKGRGWEFFLQSILWDDLLPIFGVFPVNTPPVWLGLVIITGVSVLRRSRFFTGWQALAFSVAYFAAAFGGEIWYAGWFTPLGYLWAGMWSAKMVTSSKLRILLLITAILWTGYQVWQVERAASAIHTLQEDIRQFSDDLAVSLPKGAMVLEYSIPDPYWELQRQRPDLHQVQLSQTLDNESALLRVVQQADYFVGVPNFLDYWVRERRLLPPEAQITKSWTIRAPLAAYSIVLVALREQASHSVILSSR